MSAQLIEHPQLAPPRERPSAYEARATSTRPRPSPRRTPPDVDHGLLMFGLFAAAAGVIVLDVVAAAEIDAWWFLIPAMAIHLLMTFIVLGACVKIMDGSDSEDDSDERRGPGGRPPARRCGPRPSRDRR